MLKCCGLLLQIKEGQSRENNLLDQLQEKENRLEDLHKLIRVLCWSLNSTTVPGAWGVLFNH